MSTLCSLTVAHCGIGGDDGMFEATALPGLGGLASKPFLELDPGLELLLDAET